jgi:DNA-binding MarR family transcriptional regulator
MRTLLSAYARIEQPQPGVKPYMPEPGPTHPPIERAVLSSQCNCTALRKATRRVSQLYDVVLAPCGLRTTQRAILKHILRAGIPTIGELAEALVMDRGALAHNLTPLIRDSLVSTKIDPKDRRNRLITLTRVGRKVLERSEILWVRAQSSFESAYGATKSAALREALGFIVSDRFAQAFDSSVREAVGR